MREKFKKIIKIHHGDAKRQGIQKKVYDMKIKWELRTKMYLFQIPEGEEKDNQARAVFKEAMDDNFLEVIKETCLHI